MRLYSRLNNKYRPKTKNADLFELERSYVFVQNLLVITARQEVSDEALAEPRGRPQKLRKLGNIIQWVLDDACLVKVVQAIADILVKFP